jgi:hypothetical protein
MKEFGIHLAVVIKAEDYDDAIKKTEDLCNLMKQNYDIVRSIDILDGPDELDVRNEDV